MSQWIGSSISRVGKQLDAKIFDLVHCYLTLIGQHPHDNSRSNAMAAKILQALREEDNEILYSIKDGSNHLERSQEMLSLEIKCEDEEFKMIGLEQNEALEKVLMSNFAQKPLEDNSGDQNDKKADSKSFSIQERLLVKQEQLPVKQEEKDSLSHFLAFFLGQKKKEACICQIMTEEKRSMRELPKICYAQEENSLEANFSNNEQASFINAKQKDCRQKKVRPIKKKKLKSQSKKKSQLKKEAERPKKLILSKALLEINSSQLHSKGRKPEHPEMEKDLIKWIVQKIDQGIRLTQQNIRTKARQLAISLNRRTFTASKGWMQKFFRRHPTIMTLMTQQIKKHEPSKNIQSLGKLQNKNKFNDRLFNLDRSLSISSQANDPLQRVF